MNTVFKSGDQTLFPPRTHGTGCYRNFGNTILAIMGGKEVIIDSEETKERLERLVPHADVRFIPEAGHLIPGQTDTILEFLRRGAAVRA